MLYYRVHDLIELLYRYNYIAYSYVLAEETYDIVCIILLYIM